MSPLAFAATVGALVVAGAVSATVFGHGWVWPRAADVGGIVHGVLSDPARPASGWPPHLAGRLPTPGWYWATFTALSAGAAGAAWKGWSLLGGQRSGAGRDGFARPAQLHRHASVTAARRRRAQTRPSLAGRGRAKPSEFGYPLGRAVHGGVQLWPSWEASTRLVAPSGAGKTFRVLARVLAQHPGPALATSTKSDLFELTATARQARGPVAVLDPDNLAPAADQVRWSPVAGCERSEVAERRAGALLAAAGEEDDTRNGAFFRRSARDLLKCYLHAAALAGLDIRAVLDWSRRLDDPTPADILRSHATAAPAWAGLIAIHTTGAIETTSGVMRNVSGALACFSHEAVVSRCCPPPGHGFDIARFVERNGTVYLLGKDSSLGAVSPLLTAFAQEVFDTAERLAARRPRRRLDPPLLGLLDEAPSIAPIPTLPALLADGRGRGIVIVYAMQSFSQAVTRWGPTQAETMANATSITVVFGGLNAPKDLADLERLCGTRPARRTSTHRGERNARSATESWDREPVLRVEDLRTLPDGRSLVMWGTLPPILADQPLLSADPDWKTTQADEARWREANDAAAERSQR